MVDEEMQHFQILHESITIQQNREMLELTLGTQVVLEKTHHENDM